MSRHRQKPDHFNRALDVVAATVGLIVLAPVFAVLWLIIRAKLGVPVIFVQERAGKNGRPFMLYKFRSMLEPDPERGIIIDDQRMTPFGRRLRATSLDELPTLFNVLKGDMSLVGPRPLHVTYLPRYSPHQARRHEVRPGITGLAQVMGRNSLDWEDRFDLDVQYVDEQTLLLDLKILGRTIGEVLSSSDVEAEGTATMPSFTGGNPDDGLSERLMTERWHDSWRSWQQDPRSTKSLEAEITQTGNARYWIYVDAEQKPICIAGLSGLGGTQITASILTNPEQADHRHLSAVLNRLRQHGPIYQAETIVLPVAPEELELRAAADGAGFTVEERSPATTDTSTPQSNVLTLAISSQARA